MKRFIAMGLSAVMIFALSACKKQEGENPSSSSEAPTEFETIIPNEVDENSKEAASAKEAVSKLLDTFISADIESVKKVLHEEDLEYFNFESEEQIAFYKAIWPKISYKLKGVYEHDGVYGVMTEITSPDMAEVYGRLWSDFIDVESPTRPNSAEEFRENNLSKVISMLNSDTDIVKDRIEDLFIYVEYKDGKYIARCDIYLANEIIGGAAEASSEIAEALVEGQQ